MNLAECYLQEDCFAEAAETLARIDLSQTGGSSSDKSSALFKANINVRVAELFMDESVDDCGKADMFVRKAQLHIQNVDVNEVDDAGTPVGLQIHLRYRFVFAKVLDAKRNFLQAAHEYYRITTDQTAQSIEEDDILNILKCALTCAVLGTAGPQRKRVLGVLYKDVRTQALEFHGIMTSMYKDRLLRRAEVGETPPNDGVVEPGMVVTYRFVGDDEDETETFLLGAREIEPEGLTAYSPQSPLGSAINGRSKGETVDYEAPNGKTLQVVIVDAVPYTG